ncbi:hypothetical protein EYS42_15605 [Aquabacterium lacunae]|uniref:PEP-CTERM sorting domain-containing protein n=1 Tax=Aquabacterium lacunae TaxID=2528630 RepID=A0A4Q9H247_9BURK|nr:hypothetical protein [Aquabacterium lacunae]TBO27861.1 hypothetical protein EYS42_15605 [Aquabacterium lacunae]
MTHLIRRTLGVALGLTLSLCSLHASAASFTFSGVTDSGPLAGATFSGQFSHADSPDGLPLDGDLPLSSFSLSFNGQTYTLAPDSLAAYAQGQFLGLVHADTTSTDTALRPHVALVPGFTDLSEAHFFYTGAQGDTGFGSYTVTAITPVPEPTLPVLALCGVGVAALAARRRAAPVLMTPTV